LQFSIGKGKVIHMIIVMKIGATASDISGVSEFLKAKGLGVHISEGSQATIIGVIGDKSVLRETPLEVFSGVDKLVPIMQSYKLANRAFNPEGSIVKIGDAVIGGKELAIIAGPCAVESEEQIFETAKAVRASGAKFLRGGAYKPRTSPYSFQGMEDEGLKLLRLAGNMTGLKVVSEVISENQVEVTAKYVDMFQVGARNMQNFRLLREIGKSKIPVLLKRGASATIDEWLDAAEYIMSEGNYNVVLCERGIRTFETATRNTLDICAVPVIKEKSNLPIIIDPSHAAGKAAYIHSLSMGAIAAGADGIIVEVHPDPLRAMSDAAQQITPSAFDQLCKDIAKLAPIIGRTVDYMK
jgi:3-deoxy-7-phosphoheptulonate synthase